MYFELSHVPRGILWQLGTSAVIRISFLSYLMRNYDCVEKLMSEMDLIIIYAALFPLIAEKVARFYPQSKGKEACVHTSDNRPAYRNKSSDWAANVTPAMTFPAVAAEDSESSSSGTSSGHESGFTTQPSGATVSLRVPVHTSSTTEPEEGSKHSTKALFGPANPGSRTICRLQEPTGHHISSS